MNSNSSTSVESAPVRLGAEHGYSFNGDRVSVSAEIQLDRYSGAGDHTLELWALESIPNRAGLAGLQASGRRVAQLPIGTPVTIRPHVHRVEATVPAVLPPSDREVRMGLALVEGTELRELTLYTQPERFVGPRLTGAVGYSLNGRVITLRAEQVENGREQDNRSGSLSLELWALSAPVSGAEPRGHQLARASLEPLDGQCFYAQVAEQVAFVEPPPGRWPLALVLREWTELGYQVRDVRAFTVEYEQAAKANAATTTSPEKTLPSNESPAAKPVVTTTTASKSAASKSVCATFPTAKRELDWRTTSQVYAAHPAPRAAEAARPSQVAPASSTKRVAAKAQPAKVRRLTLELAREIVRARPFQSLDELARVRGIGDRTVRRLKSLLRL